MLEIIIKICKKVIDFINALPLTDLLIGVVVPIMAAWISYYLADRAIRKKENNRLYVQIELIKKELLINDKELINYSSYVEEKESLGKSLEFPLIFMKNFLTNMLDYLQKIKQEYIRSGNFIFDKPTQTYILAQAIDDFEKEINDLEGKYYSDDYLDEKRKEKLLKLLEEKEQHIEEFKKLKDRNIYKEFESLQLSLERMMVGDVFEKIDEEDNNFILAKYIYERIKSFNDKEEKSKDDVFSLYKDLVIFEIDADIVKEDFFDQEKFDLYYKAFEKTDGIQKDLYDLCERYYKWNVLNAKIENHYFKFENKRWDENASDFVIVNDRELYIMLVEFYEKLNELTEINDSYNEKYEYCISCSNTVQNIISKLNQHEIKLMKKCK